jgi:glycosyltransferase involved in cell wall biosynthesis
LSVETFFHYLAKKYCDYDIAVFYKTGDIKQIKRLQKYCFCKQYKGEKIKCKKAFFNYSKDIINNIQADEYIEIIHRDPLAVKKWEIHPKITKFIGVSKLVCEHFKELTGKDCELIYNPLSLDKPRKVLHLISATRLTKEKGKNRMIKLANLLDKVRIPYLWTIFTNDIDTIKNPNIVYMQPKLDILDYIADADYLVQLSDDESFCYSVVEALSVDTPVIVTDCPVFKELGIVNGKNGWICDFDMSNVDVEKIYNTRLDFKYEPPKDTWGKELVKGKKEYKYSSEYNTVQATESFTYIRFKELKDIVRYNASGNKEGTIYEGDIFDCDDEIMNYLLNNKVTNGANRSLIRVLLYKDE